MFRRYLIFALFSVLGFTAAVLGQAKELKITVEPAPESSYKVSVQFKGDADGTTDIALPNEWGGQRELYKSIHGLAVLPATIAATEKPHVKTVSHRPGEELKLSYEIGSGFEGTFRNEVRYRPVVDKDFIHWIGNAVWALPAWDDSSNVKARIEWKNFPTAWTIANSFATGKRSQTVRARFGDLRQAIFVAGDFRIIRTKAAGNAVNLAIRGKWEFTDAELSEMTTKIIEVEREFFNDHSQKYYLVTLVPIDGGGPNSISIGGTGLTDSFALFTTQNAGIERFRSLLAHEYAHNWIPGKLGRMPAENEQALYWFSEGFTEFYTLKLLLKGGLITPTEFVAAYNERIRDYYMLPVRTAANDRILKEFWTDRDVQRLPYLRGFLFATNLDADIKRATGGKASLDDAIRELLAASKAERPRLSFESLSALFSKYLKREAMPTVKSHLIDGELIEPHADALGGGISQETVEIPIFELGFDFDKFAKDRIVAGLNPNSAAYAAGLRNGQQRTAGFSFALGDTSKEIELKVKDAEGEKTVKFLPVARERAKIPQYRLN